jgi:hypothetical protein
MALGTLPPWLNVAPAQYLGALEAGARAGLSIAQMRQQSAQANAARSAAAAEAEAQRQAQSALAGQRLMAEQAQAANEAGLRRELAGNELLFKGLDLQSELGGKAETARHNLATERSAEERNRISLGKGLKPTLSQDQIPAGFIQDPLTGALRQDPMFNRELHLADQARAAAADARLRGDVLGFQRLSKQAKDYEQKYKGRQTRLQVGVTDQGTPQVTFSEGIGSEDEAAPTIGTASALQQKNTQLQNAMETLNKLDKSMKSEFVGVRGTVGEFMDQWAPQAADILGMAPRGPNGERVEWRTLGRSFGEQLMRQIQDNPDRFSNADVSRIKQIVDVVSVAKNPEYIRNQLGSLRELIASRARTHALRLKEAVPAWAQSGQDLLETARKTKADLQRGVAEKRITPEQAKQQWETAQQELYDAATRYGNP